MTLARIIWNNTRQRKISSILTSLSVAVGVALVIAILTIRVVTQQRFQLGYSGYDMIVGAKGSSLQLVLNAVYQLDTSPGNVPFALYEKLKKDQRVVWAAPFSVGDNFQGFRLIGTSDVFLKNFEVQLDQKLELSEGRLFSYDENDVVRAIKEAVERGDEEENGGRLPKRVAPKKVKKVEETPHKEHFEAVIGSVVAQQTELKVGQNFVATHGSQKNDEGEHHESTPWAVVGILKPTGTPVDRAIYINLDSFYHIEGHVIEGEPTKKKEIHKKDDDGDPDVGQISAIAVKTRSPIAVWALRKEINSGSDAQVAVPAEEIRKLFSIVGNVDRVLFAQSILIILVSAVGLGLALFNSMKERRRDIAVMRALGARRFTIVQVLVGEAVLITLVGAVLGFVGGHILMGSASAVIESATGFVINPWEFHVFEGIVVLGVLVVGALAGFGPAVTAYQTDVSSNLAN